MMGLAPVILSDEILETLADAWDVLIRPNFPPVIEHTEREREVMRAFLDIPGFEKYWQRRLLATMQAEGTLTQEEADAQAREWGVM